MGQGLGRGGDLSRLKLKCKWKALVRMSDLQDPTPGFRPLFLGKKP